MFPTAPGRHMADKEKGKYPFIMKTDGVGALFGPGMVEGPFPEHYEPLEGPLAKNPMSGQLINPAIKIFKSDLDKVANADEKFPYVCTTYSCTEHWCSGSHPLAGLAPGDAAGALCRNRRAVWPRKRASRTASRSRFPRSGARWNVWPWSPNASTLQGRRQDRPSGRPALQLRLAATRKDGGDSTQLPDTDRG